MHYLEICLSYLMDLCYCISSNYWIAIILFTALTKILLLPLSLWCQKNAVTMVKIMPLVNKVKIQHFGDEDTIAEKQQQIFKQEHYHPLLSMIPLAAQIVILMGLIAVIHKIADSGENAALGLIPIKEKGWSLVWPFAAGISAFILGQAQNRINPLQREQGRVSQEITNWLSILVSFFLGIYVATGVILYWICSNLLTIPNQLLCNLIISPKKHVDYELLASTRKELDHLKNMGKKTQTKEMKKREKEYYKRFFSIGNKHLVVYSESSGFYKYFQAVIEYLLRHSTLTIHYVTNDPNDQVFELAKTQKKLKPYYIGQRRMITMMMKMDADMVLMTTPDLDNFYIKRSYVRKDIEYVYIDHAICSVHLPYREHAFDHFDTILCVGENQVLEHREIEKVYETKKKNLIPCGYGLLDNLINQYENMPKKQADNPKKRILIAPSWQDANILDSCINQILSSLFGKGYQIIVRPHPEYKKRYTARMNAMIERYKAVSKDELVIETDFSSNVTIFTADLVITDWSAIAYEFAFSTLRPPLLINTPTKIMNKNYKKIPLEPINFSLRKKVGVELNLDQLDHVTDVVSDIFSKQNEFHDRILQVRSETVFNIGHSGEAGGKYIIQRIIEKDKTRKQEA